VYKTKVSTKKKKKKAHRVLVVCCLFLFVCFFMCKLFFPIPLHKVFHCEREEGEEPCNCSEEIDWRPSKKAAGGRGCRGRRREEARRRRRGGERRGEGGKTLFFFGVLFVVELVRCLSLRRVCQPEAHVT